MYDEEVEEAVKPDGTKKQPEQVRNSLCNIVFKAASEIKVVFDLFNVSLKRRRLENRKRPS